MAQRDIEDLNEVEIKIDGKSWDDEECRRLWAKEQLLFRRYADFWRPLLDRGKALMNYAHGKIFDAETKRLYEEVLQKICVEPCILKKRINSVVGQIKQGARSGSITTEGGVSAEQVYLANMVLKYFQKEIKETEFVDEMLFTGCLTSYPQVLWFDRAVTSYGDALGGLHVEIPPWDSYALQPGFTSACGDDCHEIMRLVRKSQQECVDENPEREDAIREHYKKIFSERSDRGAYYDQLKGTSGLTIDDYQYLYFDAVTGCTSSRVDGRMLVVDRLFPAKVRTAVAIARDPQTDATLDYQILPPEWPRSRKESWAKQHPQYAMVTKNVKVLWHTRWTQEGLLLRNRLHWFQEFTNKGDPILPVAIFTPQVVDGIPTGPGADDRHLVLMKAIAETEFLHDIRTGSGDVFAYKKGKIVNAEDLPTELSIGGSGIVVVDDDSPESIDRSATFLRRSANTTYGDYSDRVNAQLDQTDMINESFQGQHVPSQSGRAKQAEIAQAIVGYSFLVDNYNRTLERLRNLECMLIPYCMTEEQVLQVYDDDRQKVIPVPINTIENDMAGNEVKSPATDLSAAKWKWRLKPGDDSPTARQAELNEMLIFWNTTAPTLIEADPSLLTLASVLKSMANHTAKEIGRIISEKAEVDAQTMSEQQMQELMMEMEERKAKADAERLKAARAGFSFSVTPEDLVMYPGVYPMLVQGGYINRDSGNQFRLPPPQQQQQQAAGGM